MSQPNKQQELNHALNNDHYRLLKTTQQKMGMNRIKLGALLNAIAQTGSWRGKGGNLSFRSFLVEEGIEPHAAHQYMTVAKCFVSEFRINIIDLDRISSASMSNLVLASKVVNEENLNDVIDILASLPKVEARYELSQYDSKEVLKENEIPKKVSHILNRMNDLTLDEKAQFFQTIGKPNMAPKLVVVNNHN